MTKKAASLLLAASLAVSVCAMPVFAGEPSNTSSNKGGTAPDATLVTYNVESSYTWSIPATIDFGDNAGVGKTRTVKANTAANVASKEATDNTDGTAPMVCVTENIIAPESALKISIDTGTSSFQNGSFVVGIQGAKTWELLNFKIAKLGEDGAVGEALDASNSEVLSVPSGTKTGKQALVLTLSTTTGEVEKAGEYTGSIVFKSEVK